MLQVVENDKSLLVDDGHSILKNLDSEINNEDMPSGDEDDEAEDDPEMLAELDAKQEELIEESQAVWRKGINEERTETIRGENSPKL